MFCQNPTCVFPLRKGTLNDFLHKDKQKRHTQHPTWIRTYFGAAESLKRKQTQEVTQFTQLSHLVIAELQLGLGARQFSPSIPLREKKKKKKGLGGTVSGSWFVKIPVPTGSGQSPTSVYITGHTNDDQSLTIHLALQDTQPKTKMLIIQWCLEPLASATPW